MGLTSVDTYWIVLVAVIVLLLCGVYAAPKVESFGSRRTPMGGGTTVWIYTTMVPSHASFHEAFCGYQRLALHTAYRNVGGDSEIRFLHPNNIHRFLPVSPSSATLLSADPQLLADYCKYSILAYYGGVWLTPNTIVLNDMHALFHSKRAEYLQECERSGLLPSPFAMLAGHRETSSAYQAVGVPNDSVVMCESGNPVMEQIALALKRTLASYPVYRSYGFARQATKMLLAQSAPSQGGAAARSVCVLEGGVGGMVDACGKCVRLRTLFSKSYGCHAASNVHWLSLDELGLLDSRHYGWFLRLDEEAVLSSEMWVSYIFQMALRYVDGSSTLSIAGSENPVLRLWDQA